MLNDLLQWLNLILLACGFLFKHKLVATPTELSNLDTKLSTMVLDKYNTMHAEVEAHYDDLRKEMDIKYEALRREMEEKYVGKNSCKAQTTHVMDAIQLLRTDVTNIGSKVDHLTELIYFRIKQENT